MMLKLFHAFSNATLNFVFPAACLICRTHLNVEKTLVCDSCWSRLPLSSQTPFHLSSGLNTVATEIYALWEYAENVEMIIHEIKFFRKTRLGRRAGSELAARLLQLPSFRKADLVAPVPLHPTRYRERGYNQSQLIAEEISKVLSIKLETKSLQRKRHTNAQAKLSAQERKKNVEDAFKVNDGRLEGRTVIIVDDVLTTGATLMACANKIKKAGASEILCATLAATPRQAGKKEQHRI